MSCTHQYQALRRLSLGRRYALRQPLVRWRQCAKNMHIPNGLIDTSIDTPSASPRAPAYIAAVGLQGILSETSSASSQKRRMSNVGKTQSQEHRKNRVPTGKMETYVPPRFKEYKIQGNASNLVQSHFVSPASKVLESGIAPLVPLGFYPACWGLNQPSPSR